MKQRIEWIDIAKGITILTVILGHTIDGLANYIIYSFHMPLFFVMSGITFNPSSTWDVFLQKTYKSFIQLVLPAILLASMYFIFKHLRQHNFSFIEFTKSILFFSGVKYSINKTTFDGIDVPWFLMSFFFARTMFDASMLLFKRNINLVFCIISTIVGVSISRIIWLPLCIDISLASLIFIQVGYVFKEFKSINDRYLQYVINPLYWGGVIYLYFSGVPHLDMASRVFPIFPVSYIISFCGVLILISISYFISNKSILKQPLALLGEMSLYILYSHILDFLWMPFLHYFVKSGFLYVSVRIIITCVFGLLLAKLLHKKSYYVKI